MPKIKFNLTRRWVRARPGSVLILVIALLVLLALIGTAYLSSTQTERYSADQNNNNAQADLLMQGLVSAVQSEIAAGLSGTVGTNPTPQYRPPQQEQPTYSNSMEADPTVNSYFNYDSTVVDSNLLPNNATQTVPAGTTAPAPPDLFLADRIPSSSGGGGAPYWNTFSFPPFPDASGNYTFDSPLGNSANLYLGVNKRNIQALPTSITLDGQSYPALTLQINPSVNGGQLENSNGNVASPTFPAPILAASASGDGIADAGLFRMPGGAINGVTYYGAIRVIDGNSAINASSANSQGPDTAYNSNGMPTINYGFFRSNIGLSELLYSATASTEYYNNSGPYPGINNYRVSNPTNTTSNVDPTIVNSPYNYVTPSNFDFYSGGDNLESQMTRRPGNPGYHNISGIGGSGSQVVWFGQTATAALAYKYSLTNSNLYSYNSTPYIYGNPTLVEIALNAELLSPQSTPWSPTQVGSDTIAGTWYYNNFRSFTSYTGTNTSPLRTILVGNNAISNAIPARVALASTPTWAASIPYQFGDWVMDGPAGAQRSFVCIQQHTSLAASRPEGGTATDPGYSTGAVQYWAGAQAQAPASPTNARLPGVPWSVMPVKTSVNTATFGELYLAFAQVMTDSVGPDANNPTVVGSQWQPTMKPPVTHLTPPPVERQMPQFRSVLRGTATPRVLLTSSQMLKLRAALAAVNTMDLRDSDNDVTSEHIVLTDASGLAAYDVEVYGTEMQPFISEFVIVNDGTPGIAGGTNYIAIELCNPYPVPITLTNWKIAAMNRSSSPLTLSQSVTIPTVTIPAASNGVPGLLILEEGTRPTDVTSTLAHNQAAYPNAQTTNPVTAGSPPPPIVVTGLYSIAIGGTAGSLQANEIFLLRTRLYNGTASTSAAANDTYNENLYLADMVPADQMDLSGLTFPTAPAGGGPVPPPYRYLYRRANDSTTADAVNKAWGCVYPGFYDPAVGLRYFNDVGEAPPFAIVLDTGNSALCNLGGPTGAAPASVVNNPASTYTTCPIELNNTNMAGPNPLVAVGTNYFPFGGFARNCDMLKIPFIGSYQIRAYGAGDSANVTELNSVTIDSALASDTTLLSTSSATASAYNANSSMATLPVVFNEQIGRFCPIGDPTSTDPSVELDFGPGAGPTDAAGTHQYWHYHWAKKLLDYLTVQSPQDDYYPNSDPPKYPGATLPAPVANASKSYVNSQIPGHTEDTAGVEGLININTAPAPVLAQLPFYGVSSVSATQAANNAQLALSIVAYRNSNGPFQSIYDLYRVTGSVKFVQASNSLLPTGPASAAGPGQGVFSNGFAGPLANANITTATASPVGAVRFDFQDRFLMLNNISNLITTHSDTFTAYVLLQGWRNVGTGHPTLAVQRREAFLIDRTGVTASNSTPVSTLVPGQ